MTGIQYCALTTVDRIFKAGADENDLFHDHFIRRMYPLQADIVNRFVHKALQLTSLPLDKFGCYKDSMATYQVAVRMIDLLQEHYAETVIALLTYSADDCVITRTGFTEALEIGFGEIDKGQLREDLWGTKFILPVVLAREALKDALKGVYLADYSPENIKNSDVFSTLQLIETAEKYDR